MAILKTSRFNQSVGLLIGIILIAISLRSPITGVGPLLEQIRLQLDLSATQAGWLTTLPLLAFALFSPIATMLGRKRGLEQALMLSLMLLLVGILVRSWGTVSTLFGGTLIIGGGIAISNVLLPGLIKRDFPGKITTITAIYTLTMGVGSFISASMAIPLMQVAESARLTFIPGWAFSLGGILIFPIIGIVIWLPQLKKHTAPARDTPEIESHGYLWRSPIAWQVTLFLGLNSLLMYIFICWLPTILVDSGYSESQAGFIHGLLQLFTALPAFILIPLMARVKDKRAICMMMPLMAFASITGLLLAPSMAILWASIFGFGAGGGFILALALVSLRTTCAHQAAGLSGMAQLVSYLLAAAGPVTMGSLHEQQGSWTLPLILCLGCTLAWFAMSLFASKSSLLTRERVSQPQYA
ncbi:MFS transporter [Dongshaea marina]|uniref:MFS transporter n=1 Tax=Dongshaea marina TaxID=2047966 RepID=UPI000D3E5CA9|nr:MFS transporter [Dongshaea marina]